MGVAGEAQRRATAEVAVMRASEAEDIENERAIIAETRQQDFAQAQVANRMVACAA